jgi:4-hydroxy-3-methylbut-2-enyl diphosphate reductase IspH
VQVQNADELDYSTFRDCDIVGLASGLSTPEDLVEAVRQKILFYDAEPVAAEPALATA